MKKMWGGRFEGEPDEQMRRLNDSFRFDRRLYAVDIQGSLAYAKALLALGLLQADEYIQIESGLERVMLEFEGGTFQPQPSDEDIHTAVERRLTELVGEPAGKLHTGRSRNDQVALDLRLYAMQAIDQLKEALLRVQTALLNQAETHLGMIMPGFTHLQPAQPVLFSHWLLSYFWMFERDRERLSDCSKRTAISPLGSGALAGNPFKIDTEQLARDLGMRGPTMNSMDAVSDRDFVAEMLFTMALTGVHLSRLAEDLILYSSPFCGYLSLSEAYTTGSSLMPQKRNPDPLELARAKSGRAIAALANLLVVMKGLPSTYNKDLQEDKEAFFDSLDSMLLTLPVMAGVIETLTPHPDAMAADLDEALLATDLADYLVEKGVPFRRAHELVGQVVRLGEAKGLAISEITLEDLQAISESFAPDVVEVFDFQRSVNRRSVFGGTGAAAVARQIKLAKTKLSQE